MTVLPGRCVPSQEHHQEQGEEVGLGPQASEGRRGRGAWQQLPKTDSQLPLCCAVGGGVGWGGWEQAE